MMDIPVSLATIVKCLPDSPFKEKVSEVRAAVLSRIAELERELAAAQAREKVLHSLSNELLHQIDINDFTDSHGHSAKMLKAVHDLMKYNTQPTDDTALNNLLAEGQANNKMLRDALFELANLHVVVHSQSPEGRAYMKKLGDLMASSDDTALRAALKAERARCCAEIKAADDKSSEDDYMLDSNDCISVIRGTWKGGE